MRIQNLLSAALAFSCGPALWSQSGSLEGEWVNKLTLYDYSEYRRMTLHQNGDQISGQAGDLKLTGIVRGGSVDLEGKNERGATAKLSGALDAGRITGTARWRGDEMKWTASRPVTRPEGAPRTHTFEPTEFHRQFSGAIPPVLRIFPGDTVKTWSVDAGGKDPKGVRRSNGGNPQTGPFYIEGALPGDTLVVHFNRIRLNRDSAISSGSIAGTAVTPYYFADRKKVENYESDWKLDLTNGVARLAKPTDKLKNYSVPLRPMLGCVGVAPQA